MQETDCGLCFENPPALAFSLPCEDAFSPAVLDPSALIRNLRRRLLQFFHFPFSMRTGCPQLILPSGHRPLTAQVGP